MKDLSFVLRGPTQDDPRPVVIAFGYAKGDDFPLAAEKSFKPYKCVQCDRKVSQEKVLLNRAGDPFCSAYCRRCWEMAHA